MVLAAERYFQAFAETIDRSQDHDVSAESKVRVLIEVAGNPGELVQPMRRILNSSTSWFRRIWTLQEAVLARDDPVVTIGKEVTSLVRLSLLQSSLNAALRTGGYDQ